MALAADSFAGRLVAVISRRAPAFRPPSPPVRDVLAPRREQFPLARSTYEAVLADYEKYVRHLAELREVAADLSVGERLGSRDAVQALRSTFTRFMEPVDELSLLSLTPFASSEEYRHRTAVSVRSATQALVVRKQIHDEVPALLESHPGTGLRHLFESLLITTDLLALSLDSCAVSLNGPRLMGSAPRLTRVGMTIARARVIVTVVSDLLNEISDDYGGADVRDVDLDDVDLSWLRWDEETQWPPTWATRIRRMSIEMSPGHWVVQPIDTTEDVELLV